MKCPQYTTRVMDGKAVCEDSSMCTRSCGDRTRAAPAIELHKVLPAGRPLVGRPSEGPLLDGREPILSVTGEIMGWKP